MSPPASARFLRMLAHQLSQPLTAAGNLIEGSLPRLRPGERVDERVVEALREAQQACRRAGWIARELRGRLGGPPAPTRLDDVEGELLELAPRAQELLDARVRVESAGPVPPVELDPVLLRDALLLLLRSADRALGERPGEAFVDLRCSADGEPLRCAVELGVRRSGVASDGRVDEYLARDGEGDREEDLTLSLARDLLRSHGASLHPPLAAAGGLVYRIHLPLVPSKPETP